MSPGPANGNDHPDDPHAPFGSDRDQRDDGAHAVAHQVTTVEEAMNEQTQEEGFIDESAYTSSEKAPIDDHVQPGP
jgi:hypothetical protein